MVHSSRVTPWKQIESAIHYRFRDRSLLKRALTHKSMASNPNDPTMHNEVLEFLGDAVLELVVTDFLFRQWGQRLNEGVLTRRRARLINSRVLSQIGRRIGLHHWVFARPESTAPERFEAQLLADTFEALIAAVYLDSNSFDVTRDWLLHIIEPELQSLLQGKMLWMDYRSLLQEYIQAEARRLPEFKLESTSGPDHQKTFVISVYFSGVRLGVGNGPSKKDAAQIASREALLHLNDPKIRQMLGFRNPPPPIPAAEAEDTAPPHAPEDEHPTPG